MTAIHISDEMLLVDTAGDPLRVVSGSLSTVTGEVVAQTIFGTKALANRQTSPLLGSLYNEQLTGAQRSIVSSSPNDTNNGSAAWSVLLTYYDASLTSLKQETLVLSGTVPVNTVANDICFIERMEIVNAGSSDTNDGSITLFTTTFGSGSAMAQIDPSNSVTPWGHHYVPVGKRCWVKHLTISVQGGVHPCATYLKKLNPLSTVASKQVTEIVRCGTNAYSSREFTLGVAVDGPARIVQYVKTDGAQMIHISGSFDFYEENH